MKRRFMALILSFCVAASGIPVQAEQSSIQVFSQSDVEDQGIIEILPDSAAGTSDPALLPDIPVSETTVSPQETESSTPGPETETSALETPSPSSEMEAVLIPVETEAAAESVTVTPDTEPAMSETQPGTEPPVTETSAETVSPAEETDEVTETEAFTEPTTGETPVIVVEETGTEPSTETEALSPSTEGMTETESETESETEPLTLFAAEPGDGQTEDGLTYTIKEAEDGSLYAVITGYQGDSTEITVPETVEDVKVTEIGDSAFSAIYSDSSFLASVTSIILPEVITKIGGYAFQGCSALASIQIPDSVTQIGAHAFESCTNLTAVKLSEGITELPSSTFWGCSSLQNVGLPSSLTSIGDSAFSGCSGLKQLSLPGTVTSIGQSAFNNCQNLASIQLPDGITRIEEYTFYECENLVSAALPANLTSIGDLAFWNCGSLADITFPGSLTELGSSAFSGCESLVSVQLPQGFTALGSSVFSGCSSLTEISLPEGLTSIGDSSFSSCRSLTEIAIPESVTEIGLGAFDGCSNLTKVFLQEGLTSIGNAAFSGCSSLSEISIPNSVIKIGSFAFDDCAGLTEISFSENLTAIDIGTFSDCSSLTKISIPEGITEIGGSAFQNCSRLAEIFLPEGLARIDSNAFYECSALSEINIPESVTEIGSSAFESCTSLAKIALPESLTTIGDEAFFKCSALTEISIPESMTGIEGYTFYSCTSLTKVSLPESLTTIGRSAFSGCSALADINIPKSVTEIGDSAFSSCTSLRAVSLPEGLTVLEGGAFSECSSLTEVFLPESLTIIKSSAFAICNALTEISIPKSVTEIEDRAFYFCKNLTGIVLPDSLTTIGSDAFAFCDNLKNVIVPPSVTSISPDAFRYSEQVVLIVEPGSYGEAYALKNNIPFQYAVGTELTVLLKPKNSLEEYCGSLLTLNIGDKNFSQQISEDTEYRFYGLPLSGSASLRVTNAYGDVLASKEGISLSSSNPPITLEEFLPVSNVQVTVYDEAAIHVTDRVSLQWKDESGTEYASGSSLKQIPDGKKLSLQFKLGSSLGTSYVEPEPMDLTVSGEKEDYPIFLEKIPVFSLSGAVASKDGAQPISGASITAALKLNGKYEHSVSVVTAKDGRFQLEVPASAGTLTVSSKDYTSQTIELPALTNSQELGTFFLEELTGAKVFLKASLQKAAHKEENASSKRLTDWNDLQLEVYNETKGLSLNDAVHQDSSVIFPSNVEAGDTLRFTFSSRSGNFETETVSFTMNDALFLNAEILLTEKGRFETTWENNENPKTQLLVYDSSGSLLFQKEQESQTLYQSDGMDSGEYTLVLMGSSSLFKAPATLKGLEAAGLTDGKDYAKQSVSIEKGTITEVFFDTVPLLDESSFIYTEPQKTLFQASKTDLNVGQYVALRLNTAFKPEYADQVSDLKWVFDLPEGMDYVEGTLSSNNQACPDVSLSGRTLSVPVSNPSDLLRLSLMPSEEGTFYFQGSLEFTLDGNTFRQPVGTIEFHVGELSFNLCEQTHETTVFASGTSPVYSDIELYDNGVLVGQSKADGYGNWKITFELYRPYTYSTHDIYARIKTTQGLVADTETKTLTYYYDPYNLSVDTVTMVLYTPDERQIIFDFQNNQENSSQLSYSFNPAYPAITFLINFSGDDISNLNDVYLDVLCSDGRTKRLSAVFQEKQECWITSGQFDSDCLPTNVSVRYDYGTENVFSREELADVNAEWEILEENFPEEGWEDLDVEGLDLTEFPEIEKAYQDYLTSLGNLTSSYQDFQNAASEFWGDASYSEHGASIQGERGSMSIETGTVENVTGQDLISQGYQEIPSDTGSPIYMKPDSDNGGLAIVDPETGTYEKHTVQNNSASADMIKEFQDIVDTFGNEIGFHLSAAGLNAEILEDFSQKAISNTQKTIDSLNNIKNNHPEQWTPEYEKQLTNCQNKVGNLKKLTATAQAAGQATDALGKALSFYGMSQKCDSLNDYYWKIQDLENIRELALDANDTATVALCDEYIGQIQNQMFWQGSHLALDIGLLFGKFSGPWGAGIAAADYGRGVYNDKTNQAFNEQMAKNIEKLRQDFTDRTRDPNFWKQHPGTAKTPIIDPSGYVYEAVDSNRIEGATASCYEKIIEYDDFGEPVGETVRLWDASDYGQQNPQNTDQEGRYGWDVPQGLWQVRVEKDGYGIYSSDWMEVPPPRFDVNFALVSYEAPTLESLSAAPDGIELRFSKYVKTDTVSTDSILVSLNGESVNGSIEFLDVEANPQDSEELLASHVRFVPSTPLDVQSQVKVEVTSQVTSYSGVPFRAASSEASVTPRIEGLKVSDLTLEYGATGTIEISASPASLTKGMTVNVQSQTSLLFSVSENQVVLDENGKALVNVESMLPGESGILFSLEGTELTAGASVTVNMPSQEQPHQHQWNEGEITTPPTCEQDGLKTYTCLTCQDTRTEILKATGHSWDEGVLTKEPVCGADGTRTYTCTVCQKTKTETVPAPAPAHTFDAGTVKTAPTCEASGEKVFTCQNCGSQKTESIPATGHSFDAGTVKTAPACEASGEKIFTCQNCGSQKTESIPATGHSFDAGTVTKTALCGQPGSRTFRCTVCGVEKTEDIPAPASAHRFDSGTVTSAASCEKSGSKTLTCTLCGTKKTETLPASGHQWSAWKTKEKATVFEAENQERTCSACGKTETRKNGKKLSPSMTLSVSSIPLKVKQKTTAVKVTDLANGDSVASWVSSNPKVAKVSGKSDGTCTVTAMNRTGSAKITVTLKSGLSKKFTVKVQKGTVKTKSLTGVKKRITLQKGKRITLTPVRKPITSQEKITYSSSDKKIVTVSSKGVLTAKRPGTAKITVKSGSKKLTCTVKVPSPAVTKIKNVKTNVSLKKGRTLTLRPRLIPSGASAKISYSSSNKKVAAVTSKGKITGKKPGKAVITVKAGKVKVRCRVTVR